MVTRHHVREHSRKGHHVRDYERGSGARVMRYSGRLTYRHRQQLPDRDFAVILADGTRKYPIENANHARNALARVSRFGNPEEKAEVCRKVHARYPGIHEKHCKMHKDPVILAEKNAATQEYADTEAAKLRSEGYKVSVRPTLGEAASGLIRVGIHRLRSHGGESE